MANKGKYFPCFQNFYFPASKDIYSLAISTSLKTLQFDVLQQILYNSPLTTENGISLRKLIVETGALDVILNCLSIFTHSNADLVAELTGKNENSTIGSGTTSFNEEQVNFKQKYEEQHIKVILELLTSYIISKNVENLDTENYEFPPTFIDILKKSCLIPVLCSYLRNDSVMDIMKKVPLYRTVLDLLKAIASFSCLSSLLTFKQEYDSETIASLIDNMRSCIEIYFLNLHKSNYYEDDELTQFKKDLLATTLAIQSAISLIEKNPSQNEENMTVEHPMSLEEKYLEVMKKLQFGYYEMTEETPYGWKFTVPYTFEMHTRISGNQAHSGRNKRLAQEAATLSTCLPVSFNSSIFVRQDEDRLDVMKCLITGSSNTPYSNGCFEFDVYFPPNYPYTPVALSYKTITGNLMENVHYINPNLYNNGHVCLSILNTWEGSPESRWNPQKSTLMEVLISIQTSVFVSEPYFNEPAYEKIRDTPKGDLESRWYKYRTYFLSIQWAIIQQIRNPSPCFKDVIYTHFWLKRNEICKQIQNWIEDVKAFSKDSERADDILALSEKLNYQYQELRSMLSQLPVPENLKDFDNPFDY